MTRWPWARAHRQDAVPEAVTSDQRAALEEAQRLIAEKEKAFRESLPEIRRVTAFIAKEQRRNHLAERFKIAFGGAARDHGH